MTDVHVRVAYEFKLQIIDKIRALEVAKNGYLPSAEEVTRLLIKYLNAEEIWENEYKKK